MTRACRRARRHHHLRCHTTGRARLTERVTYGRGARIHGWFATADGTALGHEPVSIIVAPDNGSRQWRTIKAVQTAPDGSWSAMLPSGPSRLIEAVYRGGPLTEPASSPIARLIVPASSTLHLTRVVSFGRSVRFWGRLRGGYVPPTGAIVVVQAFDRGHWRNVATVRSDRYGRWQATYAISGGSGTYPIRVQLPRQADYPWAPGLSPQRTLFVRQ
jgi:hypothetical protein